MILRLPILFFFLVLLCSCKEEVAFVPEPYRPTSEYDAYRHGLEELGLGDSRMMKMWLAESERCLFTPTYVKLPYDESLYFDDLKPLAFTYQMKSRRGQKIEIKLKGTTENKADVFLDLYHVSSDTTMPFVHMASADSTWTLQFEPLVDGEFILRVQPELLKGGRYTLSIKEVPLFAFPMAGRTESAILSLFGAERDAGKRIHEGNDIFASRHLPIIAATSGTVSYVGERGLGGKQIYITDSVRNLEVYFAHLESTNVQLGDKVMKGDTIGTNGNSGNAKTTNPHLHFGIYGEEGAIDPYHYIVPNRRPQRAIKADQSWVGKRVRTKNKAYIDHINYRYRNRRDSIPIHTIMFADAAWSRSYRVKLPDGRRGYVRSGDLTLADEPFRKRTAQDNFVVTRAFSDTTSTGRLVANEKYNVLGRFGAKEYVAFNNVRGWVVR